ncbi:hypothetical protein RvY_08541 [Ramazzottius varieornatus]|uniref:G-protein coupled receptors family 1 profile domain-containing protein n=1 Tax=Ramazzottius varieornatus TaxID=947166 RepID=A0A1D1V685_RAMVA|nr:hypothetical protein RvY_08541 [Ramazzottius varieornatus]
MFTITTAFCFNITLLVLFYKDKTLRSAFSIYLMNLLFGNALTSAIFGPLNVLRQYYGSWIVGWRLCALRQYISGAFAAIIISHCLIALNRFWAVTFPTHYRSHHNKKLAIIICLTVWVLLNACFIPTALTMSFLTPPSPKGVQECWLNDTGYPAWLPFLQTVVFDSPILLVILLYPFICWKSFFGKRMPKQARVAPANSLVTHATSVASGAVFEAAKVEENKGNEVGDQGEKPEVAPPVAEVVKKEKGFCGCLPPLKGSKKGFIPLTLMTFCVLLLWTPNELYFSLDFAGIDPPGMYQTAKILHSLATVFDPILPVVANRDLQRALLPIFKPEK